MLPKLSFITNKNEKAFTFVEVLVSILIFSIVVGIAIPTFPLLLESNARRLTKDMFRADIIEARIYAITENARGVFTFSSGNAVYTFGIDYPPYSSSPAVADIIKFRRNLPNKVTITPDVQIIMDSRGLLVDTNNTYTIPNLIFAYNGTTFDSVALYPTGMLEH